MVSNKEHSALMELNLNENLIDDGNLLRRRMEKLRMPWKWLKVGDGGISALVRLLEMVLWWIDDYTKYWNVSMQHNVNVGVAQINSLASIPNDAALLVWTWISL